MKVPGSVELGTAWNALPLSLRDHIGFIAMNTVFQGFLGGEAYCPEDRVLHSDEERGEAVDREGKGLTDLYRIIEDALPDLFGPDGENPAWAQPAIREAHMADRTSPNPPIGAEP